MNNVAGESEYAQVEKQLQQKLESQLASTGDPRVVGGAELFDQSKYLGRSGPQHPSMPKRKNNSREK